MFVTNNATKSRVELSRKFRAKGLDVIPEDIITAGSATADYLASQGLLSAYVIGEEGLLEELRNSGIDVVGGADDGERMSTDEYAALQPDPVIQAVVVSFDAALNYRKLAMASFHVQSGARLIVRAHPDFFFFRCAQSADRP